MDVEDFVFQIGMLKNTPRYGWFSIGIRQPESVAEHSFRSAVIGLLLAKKEGADADRVARLCLFHDFHEARMGDVHALAAKYMNKDAEKAARESADFPGGKEVFKAWKEFEDGKTREALVANDADALEMLAQAKEYSDEGNDYAKEWIASALRKIKTKSGKQMARRLAGKNSRKWIFEAYLEAEKDMRKKR